MANVEGYEVPDDLYYHKEHMWVRVEGSVAVVGLDDFSQKLAGDIGFLELPMEGDEVTQDDEVGSVETGKWRGMIYTPVSGEIVGINEELEDDPTVVNKDPYGDGWMFKVKMSDSGELDNLMKADAAVIWLQDEIEKHAK